MDPIEILVRIVSFGRGLCRAYSILHGREVDDVRYGVENGATDIYDLKPSQLQQISEME